MMKQTTLITGLGLALLLAGCSESAPEAVSEAPADAIQSRTENQNAVAANADDTTTPLGKIASRALELGVRQDCAARLDRMTRGIFGRAPHQAIIVTGAASASDRLFKLVASADAKDASMITTIHISPDEACSTSYEVVRVWPRSCESLADDRFKGFTRGDSMPGDVVHMKGKQGQQLLMHAIDEKSCQTVMSHAIFKL